MDIVKQLNEAVTYIEDHLDGVINKKELGNIACCSEYQFQKVFSYIAGTTLGEYIRRRRLTLAAFDLQNSDIKVIDLALKYGYESPEAFTRAFSKLHRISPSVARIQGTDLKAYPKLSFNISVRGDVVMDYRIEKRSEFTVYGLEGVFSYEDEKQLMTIPEFWGKAIREGDLDKLVKSTNKGVENELLQVNSICRYKTTEKGTFPYMLFAYKTEVSNTEGYEVIDVPEAMWAIFRSSYHDEEETTVIIQDLNRRIYTEWLPTSNYKQVEGYEMELYFKNFDTGKSRCESWIRVEETV